MANGQINLPSYKIVDQFGSAYWNKNDLRLYAVLNNQFIYLNEAVQLNYSVQEQTRPYYSYNRYVYDKINHGTRLITGELTFNFTHPGYIFSLLQNVGNNPIVSPPTPTVTTPPPSNQLTLSALKSMSSSQVNSVISKIVTTQKTNFSKDTYDLTPSVKTAMLDVEFDLWIVLGDQSGNNKILNVLNDQTNYTSDGKVAFIQDVSSPANGVKVGRVLENISIMTINQSNTDDGRPFMETYSFLSSSIRTLTNEELNNK